MTTPKRTDLPCTETFGPADVEIVDRRVCFEGFFSTTSYRVRHRLFRGGWSPELQREVSERGDAAAVLPYDPRHDRVVLVEQFRLPALLGGGRAWQIETVAGLLDGDEPAAVAHREAQEEAGLTLTALRPIQRYLPSPGGAREAVWLYLGRVDSTGAGGIHGLPHEGEDIRVLNLASDEAFALLEAGAIEASHTVIALLWLQLHRDEVRRQWAG